MNVKTLKQHLDITVNIESDEEVTDRKFVAKNGKFRCGTDNTAQKSSLHEKIVRSTRHLKGGGKQVDVKTTKSTLLQRHRRKHGRTIG